MRIALLAAGTRGDYQPILAVGRGLAARGHEVGVTATSDYVEDVRAAGLRPEPIPGDVMHTYREEIVDQMPAGLHGQMELMAQVARLMAPSVALTMRDLWPRYDGFVSTALSATWAGLFGAEPRPNVLMMFVPALPTIWGDSSLYSVEEGRSLRNLTSGLRMMRSASKVVSPAEAEMLHCGLTRRDRRRALRQIMLAPAFVANTPMVITPRRISGRDVRCAGYPFLDSPAGTALAPPVEEFLAAGPPPIYVGLGSHTLPAVRDAMRHCVDAALQLGHRVIVMRGSGLEREGRYGDDVAFVGDAPHELLFPRTAAIIHHCGAGTIAQALRAGRPQVGVPFITDQPFFARRVQEIGVAGAPVPSREAGGAQGVAVLRDSIRQALSPQVVRRAETVGEAMRAEDGVAGCVAEIERALSSSAVKPTSASSFSASSLSARRRPDA